MSATFTIPLITVIAGQTITASLWNNEFENIDTNFTPAGMDDYSATDGQMQTTTDPYPAAATSRPTSLQGEIERLRYVIAQITGETYWYIDPDVDMATFKTRFDAHTHDGTANNGPQILTAGIADAAVTSAKLAAAVAGSGLAGGAGTALSVNVDNSTLEISADTLQVKDGGIGANKFSPTYVLTTRPAFLAIPSANQTNVTGDNTEATVLFGTEIFDQGSNFAANTFTAPVTGKYLLTASIQLSGVLSGHANINFRIITSNRTYLNQQVEPGGASTTMFVTFSVVADMDAADTAYCTIQIDGSTKVVGYNAGSSSQLLTLFSGALLF